MLFRSLMTSEDARSQRGVHKIEYDPTLFRTLVSSEARLLGWVLGGYKESILDEFPYLQGEREIIHHENLASAPMLIRLPVSCRRRTLHMVRAAGRGLGDTAP